MNTIITRRTPRFECRRDGADTWTVWDRIEGLAASLGGRALVNMPLQRATTARDVLSKIYRT